MAKNTRCPACEGEGQCDTGEEYTDPSTGTRSAILAPCETCGGTGGVEEPPEPADGNPEPRR